MICDNETNSIYFSERLKTDLRFKENSKELLSALDSINVPYKFLPNTRDIWARDYMPVQINDNKFVEYRYDPDYLQGEENRIIKTYPDIVCDKLGIKTVKTDIILDGGNVIKSSNSLILTDKIIIENEGTYDPESLIEELKRIFEVKNIILIPWDEKNDFYGHADGMIRFISDTKVLIQKYFDYYPKKFRTQFFDALESNGIEWVKLEYNVPKADELRNWAYINYLQTKDMILLPKLNIAEDEQALEQFSSIFPEYAGKQRIIPIDVRELVAEGGALNCISWNIKT